MPEFGDIDNGDERGVIRGILNDLISQLRQVRRPWRSNFTGTRCYHGGKKWDLLGNPAVTPGTSEDWFNTADVNPIPLWLPGNQAANVYHVANAELHRFVSRGNPSVSPTGTNGTSHWYLDDGDVVLYNANLRRYYTTEQVVIYLGRFYKGRIGAKDKLPEVGGNDQWQDLSQVSAGGIDITAPTVAFPGAPCQSYVSLQINGQEIVPLKKGTIIQKQNIICINGVTGQVTIKATTDNATQFNVNWGENNQQSNNQPSGSTASYTYAGAAYNGFITISLADPCATLTSQPEVTGLTASQIISQTCDAEM